MNLSKITAKSTLKDLEGIRFIGKPQARQDFIKMLCFTLAFIPEVNKLSKN